MGKVSAIGKPTKLTQPSIPLGSVGQSVVAGLVYGLWTVRPLSVTWTAAVLYASACENILFRLLVNWDRFYSNNTVNVTASIHSTHHPNALETLVTSKRKCL